VKSAPIRAFLLLGEGVTQSTAESAFGETGALQVTGVAEGTDSGWRLPPPALLDVLVVVSADSSEQAFRLIAKAVEQRPQVPVVVCQLEAVELDGFMQRVFDAGADDIIALPEAPEKLVDALRKAIARKQGAGVEATLAPLIAVVGPKGGTGKTVVVCNLTAALAESGARTVVVDLDLSFGDIALGLRLTPERTLHDLVRMGGSLDAEKVEGFLTTHEASGALALLAPTRPDQGTAIAADFLTRVFAILRETNDYVVVDTPAGFPTEVITAIDSSTDICLVGMLDAFSLKDTRLGLETLRLMRYPESRIRIVLNRADTRVGINRDDVIAILGRTPDIFVPSERQITRSINDGVPIVLGHKRSGASQAFRELAKLYLSDNTLKRDNGRPSPGRRLFGRA
jgi:pilus assembly protein CpaE